MDYYKSTSKSSRSRSKSKSKSHEASRKYKSRDRRSRSPSSRSSRRKDSDKHSYRNRDSPVRRRSPKSSSRHYSSSKYSSSKLAKKSSRLRRTSTSSSSSSSSSTSDYSSSPVQKKRSSSSTSSSSTDSRLSLSKGSKDRRKETTSYPNISRKEIIEEKLNAPQQFTSVDVLEQNLETANFEEINDDSFVPKSFVSSSKNPISNSTSSKVVIDLDTDTIHKPSTSKSTPAIDDLIHPSFCNGDIDVREQKWAKKLLNYRQKLIAEG